MGHLKSKKTKTRTYNRPSAVGGEVDRVWKNIPAKYLQEGDIVANIGQVRLVMPTCDNEYYVESGISNETFFQADEQVYAFVKKGQ